MTVSEYAGSLSVTFPTGTVYDTPNGNGDGLILHYFHLLQWLVQWYQLFLQLH